MLHRWLAAPGFLVFAACAAPTTPKLPPEPSGPGITFTWPRDGQLDVPTRAPVVLHFSAPLDASEVGTAVSVTGPSGATGGTVTQPTADTLRFDVDGAFDEGTTYQLHVGAALLAGATNLGVDPLVTFTTRRTTPRPGAAGVVGFNDFAPDSSRAAPLLDVSTMRVLFDEPIDPSTVSTASVTLVGSNGQPVPANVVAAGTSVVLDPIDTLVAGQPYTLTLTGLRDLGGEAVPTWTRTLTPLAGLLPGAPITQSLSVTPAWTGAMTPSVLSGSPVNASQTASPLIGANTLGLLEGGLTANLGDASAFGGPIPMIVKRGQRLDLSPLVIRFGGVLESSYQTSTLHFTVLDDAVGFLIRNPLRPADQLPDDASPVFVDLTMDTVLTAEDPQGNALATQTLMGLRLLGLSSVDGDQLVVDQISALDLGTLGINVAPTTLALRLRTGATSTPALPPVPTLLSSYPVSGATQARPDGSMELLFSGALSADGATVVLKENGAAVPTRLHVDGPTLIVTASRRLTDGATMKLTFSGLTGPAGGAVASGALDFTVAPFVATTVPPQLASVTVGAPCAIMGGSPFAGGVCEGGQVSDVSYVGFSQASNRPIEVSFTQPMKASTLQLGTSCGQGAIRVEELSGAGTCVAPVPGSFFPNDRGFRFVPSPALKVGTRYRLVMVAGSNGTCDAGELCSAAGVPFNSDPLAGLGSAGGPDVVLTFAVTAPDPYSLQPLFSEPLTDSNGNGEIDPGETFADENRAAIEVVGTGGIVTSASLNGNDCLPARSGNQPCVALRTDLPVIVRELKASCPIDENGLATTSGGPCLEVRVLPNAIFSTSLSMNTTAIGLVPLNDLSTHGLIMRMRETGSPIFGYIMRGPADAYPQFVIHQTVALDAPDLSILGGVVSHDLQGKVLDLVLKGPVTFLPDGRMKVALANTGDVPMTVNISSLGLKGHIDLRIPRGEMRLNVVGVPLR